VRREHTLRSERPLLDILTDIFGNLEDIVRSELHLAKAEVAGELRSAKSSAQGLGIAVLAGVFSVLFLLLSGMYALRLLLTTWGAALVIAGAAALVSAVAFLIRAQRIRARRNIVPRTTASIEENLEWAQQSIK
jgi:hypothetical protein